MGDLKRELRVLDLLEAPDLWQEATARQPRSEGPQPTRHRIGTILVAVTLAAAGFLFAVWMFSEGFERSDAGSPDEKGTTSSAGEQLFEADSFVLDARGEKAILCLGSVVEPGVPQCESAAVPVTNWDWEKVDGEEGEQGAKWGHYHVVGTFDGQRFTLTAAPGPTREEPAPFEGRGGPISCPEPEGGWQAPHPDRATEADLQATSGEVENLPDFAALWIHHLDPPSMESPPVAESVVLHVAFTRNLEEHETQIRELWGGPLCMVRFEHTNEELRRIQGQAVEALDQLGLEFAFSGTDVLRNRVYLAVVLAGTDDQHAMDARFGEGAVHLISRLKPLQ
jgi:hypothetical protein